MRAVLLLDTNFSSGPMHDFLVATDHEVHVAGSNPLDALAKKSDHHILLDYADAQQVHRVLNQRAFDFVIPGCNDRSYQTCSELHQLGHALQGIDSLDITNTINDKELFRAFATRHGLPTPQVLSSDQIGRCWPVIIKPVDAYSGRGVTILQETQRDQLDAAIDRAKIHSRSGRHLVEQCVEGQLHSHSVFLSDGDILVDFIVEEHGTANPFVVDTSRVLHDYPAHLLAQLRDNTRTMARELGLRQGLLHTQFIRQGEQHWLIEVTRRCPGDLYSQLIELSTGFRYAENYARSFVNMPFTLEGMKAEPTWIMRHTLSLPGEGTLGSVRFSVPLLIEKFIPISTVGDRLKASPASRIGVLFTRSSTESALQELFARTLKRELYEITL